MSKRPPTTPLARKGKRAKVSADQSRIDSFFASPSKKQPATSITSDSPGPSSKGAKKHPHKALPPLRSFQVAAPEIIDVDSLDDSGDVVPTASTSTVPTDSLKAVAPEPSSEKKKFGVHAVKHAAFSAEKSAPPSFHPLSDDPVFYRPDSQPWPYESAPYSFLAHAFVTLSQTRSRIAIINTLTNALRTIILHHPPSLLPAIYLLSNTLAPPYSPIELGLGPSIMSCSIQNISGLTHAALRQLYNTTGDVGDVAFAAKSNVRTLVPHPPLMVPYVYESLMKIAQSKGQGAAKQKEKIVETLLISATGEEVRYLTRTLSQNLRVGAVRISILTALARAVVLTPPPGTPLPPENTTYYISSELLSDIKPCSPGTTKQATVDSARQELSITLVRAESLIKCTFVKHPNYEHIISSLLEFGLDGLDERVPLTIGIPLHPTLGSPTRSFDEIYERLGDQAPFSAEFKYDGQRAQIHAVRNTDDKDSITVKIFSRHLEDMTDKYPDVTSLVASMLRESPSITSFIMDSEIVAVDPTTGELKSFQELSNRARKDVQLHMINVSVGVFAFDLMYLNEESLLQRTFRERRALLRSQFAAHIPQEKIAARFALVESCESEAGKPAMEEFWEKAVESRCEGLMIKLLDNWTITDDPEQLEPSEPLIPSTSTSTTASPKKKKSRKKPLLATYEPDKRTSAWLKLKKDYVTGPSALVDSLDLIPMGAWHGNGRKAQWWSPILLGVWDAREGRVVAVCKCMSGFTDAFYKALGERYPLTEESETCSRQSRWAGECDFGGFRPNVYFQPKEVWEIRGADITESPISTAAFGLASRTRGLSLRFPRFIRVREDKSLEQASTPQVLAGMWRSQQGRGEEDELVDVDMEESEGFDEDEEEEEE